MRMCICHVKKADGNTQILLCTSSAVFGLREMERWQLENPNIVKAHCGKIPAELRAAMRRLARKERREQEEGICNST